MTETIYTRVNDFGSVTISLASPEDIRSWSYGEVSPRPSTTARTAPSATASSASIFGLKD
jgi:DNA-directed RNA polymerase subunit beta'